ncbi:MAG TPA: DUF1697 domain-containing protein [Bacteroidales bacterium]|nr:DUF1697 domain-containing protein [Bacteroidales bacterium]HRX97624.1 DUF1697 domain-containing protein [Bacteroidales bacterium]
MKKFVSLLRGINVGGNKKVPMSDLINHFEKMGFKNIKTILNSGNVVFEGNDKSPDQIPAHLEKAFGFEIPVITVPFEQILQIIQMDPFKNIEVTPKTRLYLTFLPEPHNNPLEIPYSSDDNSFQIIHQTATMLFSVLDLNKTGTVDAMKILEKAYGKNITTRNLNTVQKIGKL